MSDVKLCKDCRHKPSNVFDWCESPNTEREVKTFDLVNGERVIRERLVTSISCHFLRQEESQCGPGAKWFEPRPVVDNPIKPGTILEIDMPANPRRWRFWR